MSEIQTTPRALNDGATVPALGFGTYPLVGQDGAAAVLSAIERGYRLLDTAVNYENEGAVGRAIRDSGVPREQITVQTKLPGRHHAYERAIDSAYESLYRLGLDQIDVYLIHWPNPLTGDYRSAWRALVELRERGVVRTIGVCNFTEAHLRQVIADTGVVPAINQIELHPYFPQRRMRQVHEELGILTESWSPLGKRNAPYGEPVIAELAAKYDVSPAQVILRWQLELGNVPLPKSATPERQVENSLLDGFALTTDEVERITSLGRPDGRLFDGDPDTHEEF